MAVQDNALISLAEFKVYADDSYEANTEDDNLAEVLINYKTDIIHTYCNVYQFKSKTYTEYFDGNSSGMLFPKNTPITSITSIADDTNWTWGSDSTISSDYYRIVENQNSIILRNIAFSTYDQNVKVIYTAGYTTIPGNIKLACSMEVFREFKRRDTLDINSISLGDGSVQFMDKGGLMKQTKDLLDPFVHRRII